MKPSIQFLIYLVGAALLGVFYEQVKVVTGGEWGFLCTVLLYLLGLRFIGGWLARRGIRDEDPSG